MSRPNRVPRIYDQSRASPYGQTGQGDPAHRFPHVYDSSRASPYPPESRRIISLSEYREVHVGISSHRSSHRVVLETWSALANRRQVESVLMIQRGRALLDARAAQLLALAITSARDEVRERERGGFGYHADGWCCADEEEP